MKIKVCGMREPENIKALGKLKVNMLGFIFYKQSPRFVEVFPNLEIICSLKPSIIKTGVFVNADYFFIKEKVNKYKLDIIQLHGDESPGFCERTADLATVMKAFRIDEGFDFSVTKRYEPFSDYFLFDTKSRDYGGTGIRFNWSILNNYEGQKPFLLSGGITPEDAPLIKTIIHPKMLGIDINSGFEIMPGLKNIDLIETFLNNFSCNF